MKICITLGTRPEIIKMGPIIRECEKQGLDYFILHTGQHYSYNLDKAFFEQLELPEVKYIWMLVLGAWRTCRKVLIGINNRGRYGPCVYAIRGFGKAIYRKWGSNI